MSDVLVVCHLSRMFLSSVGVTGVSDVMSSEFLHELLVSAVLSRMLVFGNAPFVCDLVSVVSGVLSMMFLVCDLVSVASGVLSVMFLVCDFVSVVSGVLPVMFLVCDLVSVVSGVLSVRFLVCDLVSVVYGS